MGNQKNKRKKSRRLRLKLLLNNLQKGRKIATAKRNGKKLDEITWDPVPQTKSEEEWRAPLPNEDSSDHWPSSPEAKPEQDTTEIKISELFEEIEWDKKYPVIDLMLPPSPEAVNKREHDEDEAKYDQCSDLMPIKLQDGCCRCCHLAAEGGASLAAPAPHCRGTYADMLRECFGIEMDMEEVSTAICEYCEARLRDALVFKQQVQTCEERLKAARGRLLPAMKHAVPAMEHPLPATEQLLPVMEQPLPARGHLLPARGSSPDPHSHTHSTTIATIDFEEYDSDRDDRKNDFGSSDEEPSITEVPKLQVTKPPFENIVKEPPITKVTKPNPRKNTLRNINKPPITAAPTLKHTGRVYKRKHLALKLEPTKFENGEEPITAAPALKQRKKNTGRIYKRKHLALKLEATKLENGDEEPITAALTLKQRKKNTGRISKRKHLALKLEPKKFENGEEPKPKLQRVTYINSYEKISQEEYRCIHCSATVAADAMQKHKKRYHMYLCLICSQTFPNLYMYVRHKLEVHNQDDRVKCNACDLSFLTSTRLKYHMRGFHKLGEAIKCPNCDYECYEGPRMKYHQLVHNPVRKFPCRYCKKTFKSSTNMRTHEKIHTGVKGKVCPECGKAFVQKASLNYHMQKYHPNVKF